MEISGNRLNPYQLPAPDRGNGGRSPAEERFAQEQAAAEKRATGASREEQLTREKAVQSKGGADYAELLQRSRGYQSRDNHGYRRVTSAAPESLGVQRALDAYRSTANDLEGSGVELLPRVDRYV